MKKILAANGLRLTPVNAHGDLPTRTKGCMQNCGGLYNGTTVTRTGSDEQKTDEIKQDDSTIVEITPGSTNKYQK